jgi:hypothetical protein
MCAHRGVRQDWRFTITSSTECRLQGRLIDRAIGHRRVQFCRTGLGIARRLRIAGTNKARNDPFSPERPQDA